MNSRRTALWLMLPIALIPLVIGGASVLRAGQRRHADAALMHAIKTRDYRTAQRLLFQKQADPNARDDEGRTALWWPASQGDDLGSLILIQCGADINARDNYGGTPLMAATFSGDENTLQLLLLHADINAKTEFGTTALHQAALSGHVASVRVLLDHGAKLEARTRAGETPLFKAAQAGHAAVVKYLLSRGADANAQNSDGQNALAVALKNHRARVAKILQDTQTATKSKGKVRLNSGVLRGESHADIGSTRSHAANQISSLAAH